MYPFSIIMASVITIDMNIADRNVITVSKSI